jgi:S-adenosyl methyltransferase
MTDRDRSRRARLVVVPDPDGDARPGDLAPGQAANPARIYDYLLGGKDNYAADRLAGQRALAAIPEIRNVARANSRFLVRAVRFAAEQGIGQFIDLGTGFPTSPNVHEVARGTCPGANVIYVDNDPVVTAHNRRCGRRFPGWSRSRVTSATRTPCWPTVK